MPVVQVDWLEGRTSEQKKKLASGISKAFEEVGVKKENVHIIIRDTPKDSWAVGDKMMSER